MSDLLLKIATLLAIFACLVLIGTLAFNFLLTRQADRRVINERLDLMRAGSGKGVDVALLRADHQWQSRASSSLYARLCVIIARAELRRSPDTVVMWMGLACLSLTIVLLILAGLSGHEITVGTVLMTATVAVSLGGGLPLVIFSRRATQRRKRLEEQFPAAVEIFTRALRAGHPITSALELLTEEMEDPIGSEFGLVADEVAYGADLGDSLANLARRWDLPDVRMFSVCLSVQNETGGNLAEILTNLNSVIRERNSLFLMVRALSAEGRISALLMSILPVLTFSFLFLVNPDFYLEVAADPMFTQGYAILVFFYFVGVFWIRRMVDLKV